MTEEKRKAAQDVAASLSGRGIIYVSECVAARIPPQAHLSILPCSLSIREVRILRHLFRLADKLPGRFVPYPTLSVCAIAPESDCRQVAEDWDGTVFFIGFRG